MENRSSETPPLAEALTSPRLAEELLAVDSSWIESSFGDVATDGLGAQAVVAASHHCASHSNQN